MITNRKFTVAFSICFLLYLLPEIFASEAMLYITGGVIGGTIGEIFKGVAETLNTVLIFAIWSILLIGLIILYFKVQYKSLKLLILLLIAFFLYIVDNLLAIIPFSETQMQQKALIIKIVVVGLSISIKSLLLSWTYYKGNKS
jgi:hypothetical protein